jgi:hypothetical protein
MFSLSKEMLMGRTLRFGIVVATVLVLQSALSRGERQPQVAPGAASPAERAALLEAREKVWRAWFANDRAALREILPPETVAGDSGEPGWLDRDKVLASSEKFAAGGSKLIDLQFPATQIQCYGDVAVLYTTFRFETETKGKRSVAAGKGTETFVKRGGRWLNSGWLLAFDK